MFAMGNHLWNAGIFLFRAKDMISAFKKYKPNLLYTIQDALKKIEVRRRIS